MAVGMKKRNVTVRWPMGLHLLPATGLARLTQTFRSKIRLSLGSHVADASSVLSILILCASLNAVLEIEATGDDEHEALRAVEAYFDSPDREA